MLQIRESQVAALGTRARPAATDLEIAAALGDLGWFDATNDIHRRIIGAASDSGNDAVAGLLTRFVGVERQRAARAGITHEHLVLEYTGFFFRYFPDWPSRDDAATLLAETSLGEAEKMKTIARKLRLASLRAVTP